jgi:hypothetical protein
VVTAAVPVRCARLVVFTVGLLISTLTATDVPVAGARAVRLHWRYRLNDSHGILLMLDFSAQREILQVVPHIARISIDMPGTLQDRTPEGEPE